MFIEPGSANCAYGLLLWSLIPTWAGRANARTVPDLGGVLGAEYRKIRGSPYNTYVYGASQF